MDSQRALYEVADELRAVAHLGLQFVLTEYDRERYQKVLLASARIIAAADGFSDSTVLLPYADNLEHVSPLLGASAAVFRAEALLLLKRPDNGLWDLPGGLVEVGETLASAAERELLEETGLPGTASRILGIWDSRRVGARVKAHMFDVCFEVRCEGSPSATLEALEVGFFRESLLPELSPGADVVVPAVFRLHESSSGVWFDRGR